MKLNNIISFLNFIGIVCIVYFLYNQKPIINNIDNSKIIYKGDTTLNYNTYKKYLINNYDTNIIVNNTTVNEYGDTIISPVGIKAHKYVSTVKDGTIVGNITTLTDGNIFDVDLDYKLVNQPKSNPFTLSIGLDFSSTMLQPNILFGKQFKVGAGYDLINKNIVLKTNYIVKLKK
jgi:hypothetical protein